jgi:ParB-like chromosome segregation protein Spo0J
MTTTPVEIRILPLESLIPAPYNPRVELQPGSPTWSKLAASLREFGLVEPLVWNETTGHVVGGHTRLRILKEIGVREVPVSVVRLTSEREKALNIILNNREAQGRFDSEKLAALLAELQDLPEMELTGFDRGDLANFQLEPAGELPPVEDGPDRIEITLTMDAKTHEQIAPRLDAIISEFDLENHVRR